MTFGFLVISSGDSFTEWPGYISDDGFHYLHNGNIHLGHDTFVICSEAEMTDALTKVMDGKEASCSGQVLSLTPGTARAALENLLRQRAMFCTSDLVTVNGKIRRVKGRKVLLEPTDGEEELVDESHVSPVTWHKGMSFTMDGAIHDVLEVAANGILCMSGSRAIIVPFEKALAKAL